MATWNLPAERTVASSSIVADLNAIRDILILLGGNGTGQPSSDIEALKALVDAVPAIPVGGELPYSSETLPSGGSFQWKEGASLVRADYPTLRDLYIVSRGAVTITEANPGVVTLNSHGFGTASCISLATTGTLPTNLAINTNYYVIYVNANTFRLATSADNARAGTAINTTGAIMAGVHTLYSNPHGINGTNSFYLPDGNGLVMKQDGDATINGRTKSGPAFGAVEEDQGQVITGSFYNSLGLLWNSGGVATVAGAITASATISNSSNASGTGPAGTTKGLDFDSALVARAGAKNQENSMGVKMIVRVI